MIDLGMTLPDVHAVLDLDAALILSRSISEELDEDEDTVFSDDEELAVE